MTEALVPKKLTESNVSQERHPGIMCSKIQKIFPLCALPLALIQFHALKTVGYLGPTQKLHKRRADFSAQELRSDLHYLSILVMTHFHMHISAPESLSVLTLRTFAMANSAQICGPFSPHNLHPMQESI